MVERDSEDKEDSQGIDSNWTSNPGKLPVISGNDVIKALEKAGFKIVGRKDSHVRLKKKTEKEVYIVIVPLHKELKKGTLNSIIRRSGLTREEFLDLL